MSGIEMRRVVKSFNPASGQPVRALSGVDLTVAENDYVALVGESGSGKSTLLHIVGLLETPDTGQHTMNGADVGAMSDQERSRARAGTFGFVFQGFHLLTARTALENVALGSLYQGEHRDARMREANGLLRAVGLAHRSDAVAGTLSGGERQRVAIARAMMGSPSVLIADEPTGNLDDRTANAVMSLMEAFRDARGLAMLVVTHSEEIAARADRVLRMNAGTLVEEAL